MKKEKEKKEKPIYNMWQNTAYVFKLGAKLQPVLIVFVVLSVLAFIFISLVNIYRAPVIIEKLEQQASIKELMLVIIFFTVLAIFEAISNICFDGATTSFPNFENTKFQEMYNNSLWFFRGGLVSIAEIWFIFIKLFSSIALFVIYIVMLSDINIILILVMTALSLIGYFASKTIGEFGYRKRYEIQKYRNEMEYVDRTSNTHIKDLKMFGLIDWINELQDKSFILLRDMSKKTEMRYITADILDLVLSVLKNGIAYVYIINITLKGDLSSSEFLLYFSVVTSYTAMLSQIMGNLGSLRKQSLDYCIIREFLDTPEPFKFEDGISITPEIDKAYEIELRNVSFRYENAEKDTLQNINLKIKYGEKIAVVGLNGAGKTTLVNLICGLYDPTQGEVLLNGVNIKEYNRSDYYKHFSTVFQDFSILATTIAQNVTQQVDNFDYDKIADCIEKSGLTKKINSLPNKLETQLTSDIYEDGIHLSGGETQRLMLARSLYKNAPILILDEPTAALDPIAENEIYTKYNDMSKGKSSIFISHRLASTRFCDRIILLDNSQIVEEGTHDSLLALNGIYANLFEVQSKYYKDEEVAEDV